MRLNELREKRTEIAAEMRAISDKVEAEQRDYSAEEDKRHKELKVDLTALDRKIERAQDLAEAERAAPAILHHGRGDGRFEDRARGFSLVKAINARLGDPVDAGFEREISSEVQRRSGRPFQGIAVPDEYFHVERRAFGDNVLTIGGNAADLYPTVHRPDLFIDKLRSAIVVGRLGATVLDGLVGTNDIPRQTASATASWLSAEDASLSDTAPNFDDVTLAPKTIGSIASYSRRTLINAVPSIENIVRNDLAAVVANAIDVAAMAGTGQSGEPTGITGQTAAHSLTLATPTWAQVLEFIASIQMADAEIGSLGWAMNPHAVKKLRSTLVAADTDSRFIMMEPGTLAGYPAAVTSALPGTTQGSPDTPATVIFGAWSQLLVGYWSGLDVLVNPYESTAYQKGRVLVRAMRDVDVQVRHGESFAFATDLPVA